MRLSAEVELAWGPGVYTFGLKAKQIEELEKSMGVGIGRITARIHSNVDFYFRDVRDTIFFGLIGGGMPPVDARGLVESWVDNCPLEPLDKDGKPHPDGNLMTARAILGACRYGWEDLPEAAPSGEPEARTSESTSDSTGPHS
jgi:hypothetical protein